MLINWLALTLPAGVKPTLGVESPVHIMHWLKCATQFHDTDAPFQQD